MDDEKRISQKEREEVPLSKAAQFLLEECRMVLPGIQTLFGFQLVAVFSSRFGELLTPTEQRLHLLAFALVALSVGIIMMPAAYHRRSGPLEVTKTFIRLSTRLLLYSMWPLALSISLEFYLIAHVILGGILPAILGAALFAFFVAAWFIFPRIFPFQRA